MGNAYIQKVALERLFCKWFAKVTVQPLVYKGGFVKVASGVQRLKLDFGSYSRTAPAQCLKLATPSLGSWGRLTRFCFFCVFGFFVRICFYLGVFERNRREIGLRG